MIESLRANLGMEVLTFDIKRNVNKHFAEIKKKQGNYAKLWNLEVAPNIYKAFKSVDRAPFVPSPKKELSYKDRGIEIRERTEVFYHSVLTRPSTMVMMTHFLQPENGQRFLVIGTGSGYQDAILSKFGEVHSIEYDANLAIAANERLRKLGYKVTVHAGMDGGYGLPEAGKFDRILVTAGTSDILENLREQLTEDGIMIQPCGKYIPERDIIDNGSLFAVRKSGNSQVLPLDVFFVPLMSTAVGGWVRDASSSLLIPASL